VCYLRKNKKNYWVNQEVNFNFFVEFGIEIHPNEIGVKSNRISARFGECLPSQVIYRPSRAERFLFMKSNFKPSEFSIRKVGAIFVY
jgi:hypothetical protein